MIRPPILTSVACHRSRILRRRRRTGLVAFGAGAGHVSEYDERDCDYIGQGRPRNYTPDTTSFEGAATCDRNQVRIYANSGNGDWWYVTMQAPKGTPLTSGTYNYATRWPFQASVTPGLDVSGEGRGCNRSWGSFIISEASFGPNGKLQRFHATFEQRCEQQSSPGLRGEIRVVDIPVWGGSTCP